MIVELSQSGHYPSSWVEVTKNEFARLKSIESRYGYLWAAKGEDEEFVYQIVERSQKVKPKYETILLYV